MVLGLVGYKGGVGKTTLGNFIADKMGESLILNLDYYQKFREDTQKISTVSLDIDDDLSINELKERGIKNIIVDCGGFDDKRIFKDIEKFDTLIFPTRSDIGDLRMLADTINTVLEYRKTGMKIFICVNDYIDYKELEETIDDINELILPLIDEKFQVEIVSFSHSKTVKRMNKERKTLSELELEFKSKQKRKSAFSPYIKLNNKIEMIVNKLKEVTR